MTTQAVDVGHLKVDSAFVGHSQEVQHRIGGTTHGNIEGHGVEEGCTDSYAAWQDTIVALFVILISVLYDESGCVAEELYPIGMGGQDCSVTGERETDSLGQAVHRVCREHSRTAAAAGTGAALDAGYLLIAYRSVGRLDHRCDEVGILTVVLVRLHGTARNKHGGNVQPHGGHEHTGCYLVAVADAHHGVGLVRIDHIFDAVGYQVARGKRIEHSVVPHGDTIVDGYCIELGSKTAKFFNLGFNNLAYLVQMHMARNKLGE